MINETINIGSIHGLKLVNNSPIISHLLFADDILLFCESSVSDAINLKNVLERFSTMSSQIINYQKSSIIFSNTCPNTLKAQIKNIFMVPDMDKNDNYLGSYLFKGNPGYKNRRAWRYLIGKKDKI